MLSEMLSINFKLRVGYGTTGNCNIDNYMYATAYNATVYPVGNQETAALAPGSTVGNNNLKMGENRFYEYRTGLGFVGETELT